ncbi:hypothetical protein [Sinorhizobium meliloti]|uniref:hypothetical protein n=1 Tax=Rhizobium meliloti TaxID=382 RepID=UPI0013E2F4B9|nr:hypothetical protein [Sinorhizobium meliloti]
MQPRQQAVDVVPEFIAEGGRFRAHDIAGAARFVAHVPETFGTVTKHLHKINAGLA